MAWSAWMESGHRVVCHDRMESYEGPKEGAIFVSTVFLGVDYNFAGVGPPVLWETMVFQGLLDGYCRRYTSKEAAYEGHQAICQEINATLTPRLTGNNQPVDPD
jgi:hypothetical protein